MASVVVWRDSDVAVAVDAIFHREVVGSLHRVVRPLTFCVACRMKKVIIEGLSPNSDGVEMRCIQLSLARCCIFRSSVADIEFQVFAVCVPLG